MRGADDEDMPEHNEGRCATSHLNLDSGSFVIGKLCGRGGSAIVYEATKHGRKFALKVISARTKRQLKAFEQEVRLLERFSSGSDRGHVVKCYGSRLIVAEAQLYIVLEHAYCDFEKYLEGFRETVGGMALGACRSCWRQMVDSVDFIHAQKIIHQDLKPANFLVMRGRRSSSSCSELRAADLEDQGNCQIKLSDFGLARSMEDDKSHLTKYDQCGTVRYMSPESLYQPELYMGSGHEQDEQSCAEDGVEGEEEDHAKLKITPMTDIWSLGIILYQMFHLRTPYDHFKMRSKVMFSIIDPRAQIQYPEVGRFVAVAGGGCSGMALEREGVGSGASCEDGPKSSSYDIRAWTAAKQVRQQKKRLATVEQLNSCLQRCLRREPSDRWSAAELRAVLAEIDFPHFCWRTCRRAAIRPAKGSAATIRCLSVSEMQELEAEKRGRGEGDVVFRGTTPAGGDVPPSPTLQDTSAAHAISPLSVFGSCSTPAEEGTKAVARVLSNRERSAFISAQEDLSRTAFVVELRLEGHLFKNNHVMVWRDQMVSG
eukprot:g13311.t1